MSITAPTSELARRLWDIRNNPSLMQGILLDELERLSNDDSQLIVDASNPFVFLLNAACVAASAAIGQSEVNARQLYPSLAQLPKEVYRHLSDTDYISIFNQPSTGTFKFLLGINEIIAKAIPDPAVANTKKLTIPRYTEIGVGDMKFTMQLPVDIRIMPHGSFHIAFDTTVSSPIYSPTTNILSWGVIEYGGIRYVEIDLPLKQMAKRTHQTSFTSITGYKRSFDFEDQFHFVRAFITTDAGLVEINTTHSDQVYNHTVPTLVYKILNRQLEITIPQIYFNNGLITDNLRVDIYTTKGAVELNLSDFGVDAYDFNLKDVSSTAFNAFSAPLKAFPDIRVYGTGVVTGGRSSIDFNELRRIATTRSVITEGLPITPDQLVTYGATEGFDIVTGIDRLNERKLLATRNLPNPATLVSTTGANMSMQTMVTALNDLFAYDTVFVNGNTVTITPDTLFRLNNGKIEIAESGYIQQLKDPTLTNADALSFAINNDNLMYTPFYYVLDSSVNEFSVRAYSMDTPSIERLNFIGDNPALGIMVDLTLIVLVKNPDLKPGYSMVVEVAGDATFNELNTNRLLAQLAIPLPTGGKFYVSGSLIGTVDPISGKPTSGVYRYRFDFDTRFEFDRQDNLLLTPSRVAVSLTPEIDFCLFIKDHMPIGAVPSVVDQLGDVTQHSGYLAGSTYMGLTAYRADAYFGKRLKYLWARNRTAVKPAEYMRYTADVQRYHEKDVYETDATGTQKLTFNSTTGQFERNKLFSIGDPVVDEYGQPVLSNRAGDTVKDAFGNPIILNGGVLTAERVVDVLMVDAKYYFANDDIGVNYREQILELLTEWCSETLERFQSALIGETQLLFHPKNSVGAIEVMIDSGERVLVKAEQSLTVTFYVTAEVSANASLRQNIVVTTLRTLHEKAFTGPTISTSTIITTLKEAIGTDIIGLKVTGFMENKYDAITLVDGRFKPSMAKVLKPLSNLTVQVQDNLVTEFIVM